MDIVGWPWWLVSTHFTTRLQMGLPVAVIHFLKYGWQWAPQEIRRRSGSDAWLAEMDRSSRSHPSGGLGDGACQWHAFLARSERKFLGGNPQR